MTGAPEAEKVAGQDAPAATGDRACLWLAMSSVASWLATTATSSLLLALLTLVLMSALTGLATYTVVPGRGRRMVPRLAATALTVVAVGVFVVAIDSAWSWAIPPVALAAGLPTARPRTIRLLALAIMATFVIALWVFGIE